MDGNAVWFVIAGAIWLLAGGLTGLFLANYSREYETPHAHHRILALLGLFLGGLGLISLLHAFMVDSVLAAITLSLALLAASLTAYHFRHAWLNWWNTLGLAQL